MTSIAARHLSTGLVALTTLLFTTQIAFGADPRHAAAPRQSPPAATVTTFDSPQQAADALIGAADLFDVAALERLFGPTTKSVVLSSERAMDRERARQFVAKAREKHRVSIDAKARNRAVLIVGNTDWPFPIPIVKRGGRWMFDTAAGAQEMLRRRVGANELDAIAISRGYVEAQHEYALKQRDGYDVNQYAQRIIATSGKQDGLAWKNADGT